MNDERAAATGEVDPRPPPRLEIPPRAQPAPPRANRRGWAMASWVIAVVVILAALAIAATLVRRQLAADSPSAARLHAATGQSAAASETGLAIRGITPKRTTEGLMIDGEITNLGSSPRDIPRLRLALQDSAQQEVRSKTVDPPKARLQPGEVTHFEIPFTHPPDAATGVVVTFASP